MKSQFSWGLVLAAAALLLAGAVEAHRGGRMLLDSSSETVSSGVGSDSDGNDIVTNSESSELAASVAIGFSVGILTDPGIVNKRKMLQTTQQVDLIETWIKAVVGALSVERERMTCTSFIDPLDGTIGFDCVLKIFGTTVTVDDILLISTGSTPLAISFQYCLPAESIIESRVVLGTSSELFTPAGLPAALALDTSDIFILDGEGAIYEIFDLTIGIDCFTPAPTPAPTPAATETPKPTDTPAPGPSSAPGIQAEFEKEGMFLEDVDSSVFPLDSELEEIADEDVAVQNDEVKEAPSNVSEVAVNTYHGITGFLRRLYDAVFSS
eukprot:CAMPEP_0117668400 /NCGR_PEP_ID=MMETSP0804-20121206/11527_1 /TAXON_ID=1074897 /ORGANISM="Tetraselmis astigmatica, Strain CCMP880" /LENGTH=323 /DNA_ID=CAMNT_0005476285 /DNA_START=192 /DNA_END=1163 /DNA_ORIENTATION=-